MARVHTDMMQFFHFSWFKAFGTAAVAAIAETNLPMEGIEKISAMGLLGIFVWFTLTRLETAIKENALAVKENSLAIIALREHLDERR